jgi:hypothetical protein
MNALKLNSVKAKTVEGFTKAQALFEQLKKGIFVDHVTGLVGVDVEWGTLFDIKVTGYVPTPLEFTIYPKEIGFHITYLVYNTKQKTLIFKLDNEDGTLVRIFTGGEA